MANRAVSDWPAVAQPAHVVRTFRDSLRNTGSSLRCAFAVSLNTGIPSHVGEGVWKRLLRIHLTLMSCTTRATTGSLRKRLLRQFGIISVSIEQTVQ